MVGEGGGVDSVITVKAGAAGPSVSASGESVE